MLAGSKGGGILPLAGDLLTSEELAVLTHSPGKLISAGFVCGILTSDICRGIFLSFTDTDRGF